MNSIDGTITPVEGDIYYYETMEELDAHEVEGDRRRAQLAMLTARLVALFLVVIAVTLLFVFRSSLMMQILCVLGMLSMLCAWYLYDLLELCDD